MGFFGKKESKLQKENERLKKKNTEQKKRIKQLEKRSDEKDRHFKALMSDATRHGSKLGASYMADRKKYLKGK